MCSILHKISSSILICLIAALSPLSHAQNIATSGRLFSPSRLEYRLTQQGFAPNHEDSILLAENYNGHLYSLDKNALLKISASPAREEGGSSNEFRQESFAIIDRELLQQAWWYSPYIISLTASNTISIYSVPQDLLLAKLSSDGSIVKISQDRTLLVYTHQSDIIIMEMPSQTVYSRIEFLPENPPEFIEIATNNKNLMIYYRDGIIEYRQCNNGRLLQRIPGRTRLSSLQLSKNRRFAVGFQGSNLISLDVLRGNVVTNLLLPQEIHRVVPGITPNTILVQSRDIKNTTHITGYEILKQGQLQLNDSLQLVGLTDVSFLSHNKGEKEESLFIGNTNGTLRSYNIYKKEFTSLYANETQAILDGIIIDEHLVLAKPDAVIRYPMDELLPLQKGMRSTTHEYRSPLFLQYNNPDFLLAEELPHLSLSPNVTLSPAAQTNSLSELSSTSSGSSGIAQGRSADLEINDKKIFYIISNKEPSPLLYSLSSNLQLMQTQPLQFRPSELLHLQNNELLYYQNENATLVHSSEANNLQERTFHFLSNNLHLYTQKKEDTTKLWINNPLHTQEQNVNDLRRTRLWSYSSRLLSEQWDNWSRNTSPLEQRELAGSELEEIEHIDLPFAVENILYLEPIDNLSLSQDAMEEIATSNPNAATTRTANNTGSTADSTQNTTRNVFTGRTDMQTRQGEPTAVSTLTDRRDAFLLVHNDETQQTTSSTVHLIIHSDANEGEDPPSLFPVLTSELGRVSGEKILHARSYGAAHEGVLLFTQSKIILIAVDPKTLELTQDTRFFYPEEFGIPYKIRAQENYIILIDRNNVMLVLSIQNYSLQREFALMLTEKGAQVQHY